MKRTGKNRFAVGSRWRLLASCAVLAALLGWGLLLPLAADDTGSLPSLMSNTGTPTRGETGWINLPYLRGLVRVDRTAGKALFEHLKSLSGTGSGLVPENLTSESVFVIEGPDAQMAPAMVTAGVPQVTLASTALGWQALFIGAFRARLDPQVVRPGVNDMGVCLPKSFCGGVVRITDSSTGDELFALVEDPELLLSWPVLAGLLEGGGNQVSFEGYNLEGQPVLFSFHCFPGDGNLFVTFGFGEE